MANSIITVEKYLPLLDEAFIANALTRDLEANEVLFAGSPVIKVKKITTPNGREYKRDKGFVNGDAGVSWETYELKQDRQIAFDIDRMDNEETLGNTFGQIAGHTIRYEQVPEVDLYRFSTIAQNAYVTKGTPTDFADGEALLAEIDKMEESFMEKGIPLGSVILYLSAKAYTLLKRTNNFQRFATTTDRDLNRNVTTFDEMRIVIVPKDRFYDKVEYETLTDGDKGELQPASDAKEINFIGLVPEAVFGVMKYSTLRTFDASVNQQKDAYLFQLRYYHDMFVYQERGNGVYVSVKAS